MFKVLLLTTVLPHNKLTGGEIVTSQIIGALKKLGCMVKVIGYKRPDNFLKLEQDDIAIQIPYIESSRSKLRSTFTLAKSFITHKPYSYTKYISKEYRKIVKVQLASQAYDLLIIDHLQMSWILELKIQIPIVLIEHNVEHDLYHKLSISMPKTNFFMRLLYLREYRLLYEKEKNACEKSSYVLTLNDTDKEKLNNFFNVKNLDSMHIPGGFETLKIFKEKKYSVTMLGTWNWDANKQGLEWFVKFVYPHINNTIDIHVGGRGAEWLNGKYTNIIYHGFVENAQDFLSNSKCIIIPSVEGGGIQIKTLDAISSNIPVVATSVAVRGIEEIPEGIFIVDDPKCFAEKINYIQLHGQIETNGYKWTTERAKGFEKKLKNLIESIVVNEENSNPEL